MYIHITYTLAIIVKKGFTVKICVYCYEYLHY